MFFCDECYDRRIQQQTNREVKWPYPEKFSGGGVDNHGPWEITRHTWCYIGIPCDEIGPLSNSPQLENDVPGRAHLEKRISESRKGWESGLNVAPKSVMFRATDKPMLTWAGFGPPQTFDQSGHPRLGYY